MQMHPTTCLTIVAEAVVEQRLLHDLQASGARGWTITPGTGRGSALVGPSEWAGPNVRVETLVSRRVADRILEVLDRDYFPYYSVVAWVSEVRVVRPERFG
ncbi:MAG: P-II family nitrogen regulator [Kineosporiaceae bacterium]